MKNDLPERFSNKVVRGKMRSDCDLWTGARTDAGYGLFRIDGRSEYVHRYVWECAHGPIPSDKQVHHKCDNANCVKLAHLTLRERSPWRKITVGGNRYNQALTALNLNHIEAAAFLDLTKRTSRDYAVNGAPRPINILLALMIKQRLSVDDVNRIVGRP